MSILKHMSKESLTEWLKTWEKFLEVSSQDGHAATTAQHNTTQHQNDQGSSQC